MLTTVRQWWLPREFRIPKPAWPRDALALLTEAARAPEPPPPDAPAPEATPAPGVAGATVADVATGLWRLRNRMPADGNRSLVRQLDAAWDALTEAGVEVDDHMNDPFDAGLAISVVAYQPTPGLRREQVIEAIRPTVYLNDRAIQKAEVIVGTPE